MKLSVFRAPKAGGPLVFALALAFSKCLRPDSRVDYLLDCTYCKLFTDVFVCIAVLA